MKSLFRNLVVLGAAIFLGGLGFSDTGFSFSGSGDVFKLNKTLDSSLLGAGVLLSGGDLLLDNVLKINRQKYDGRTFDRNDVNAFDRRFMHSYSRKLDITAGFTLTAAMLTPAVLLSTDKNEWTTVAVMYAETLLISNGIKEMMKLCINRTRPYMYYDGDRPQKAIDRGDWANSFPSGHTTMAFAGATFAAYTFCKYFPDSNLKYAVAAGSYAIAAVTAVLRLKSGNHFVTDVLAGSVIGSGVGFLVPWLHTFGTNSKVKVNAMPAGLSFTVQL